MTSVNTVAATGSSQPVYATQPTRQPSQTMGADQFMHLLVVQLQNQDPTSPMDTGQMVQQTTQLAMMQSMQDISTATTSNLSLQQASVAASMIGKTISYLDANGQTQTGTATGITLTSSGPLVKIGGTSVTFSQITGIDQAAAA